MKRICCFCETWESGGIESFLYNVLSNADLTDVKVDVVSVKKSDSIFTEKLRAHGIDVVGLTDKKCSELKKRRLFRNYLKQVKYDTIHFNLFHSVSLGYVSIAMSEGVNVRLVHSHNTNLRKTRMRWLKLILHNFAKRIYTSKATRLMACSEAAAGFLFSDSDLNRMGYTFIPNGIVVDRFAFDKTVRDSVRKEMEIENNLVIGSVGRLCYQKNQSFLIDVLYELNKVRSDCRLLLVGEGDDFQVLKQKAESMGVLDKIIFYGVTDEPEKLFMAMDVMAFPSLFEGLGIVAIEAQASGLPVVCSEFVPHEAHITDLITVCSLSEGAAKWADTLQKVNAPEKRNVYTETVKKSGFDISHVSHIMERLFKGEF